MIRQAPFPGARINRAHPLARGLVHAWRLDGDGTTTLDLMGAVPIIHTSPAWSYTDAGRALDPAGTTKSLSAAHAVASVEDGFSTLTVARIPTTAPTANQAIFSHYGSGQNKFRLWHLSPSGNSLRMQTSINGSTNLINQSWDAPTDGLVHAIGTRATSQSSMQVRVRTCMDGILQNGSNVSPSTSLNSLVTSIGNDDSGSKDFAGDVLLCCIWNRPLTDADLASITQDPWQLFTPMGSRAFLVRGQGAAGGTAFTGALDATLGGVTLNATATHSEPVYDGALDATLGGVSLAASATHTEPVFDGALDASLGGVVLDAAATFAADVFTGALDAVLGGVELAANATHSVPVYDGTLDAALGGVVLDAQATHAPPTVDASLDAVLGGVVLAATATFAPGSVLASLDAQLGGVVLDATGTFSPGTKTAALDVSLGGVQLTATATFTEPVYDGTLDATLPGILLDASATFIDPGALPSVPTLCETLSKTHVLTEVLAKTHVLAETLEIRSCP